jgi:hypothetical protein
LGAGHHTPRNAGVKTAMNQFAILYADRFCKTVAKHEV